MDSSDTVVLQSYSTTSLEIATTTPNGDIVTETADIYYVDPDHSSKSKNETNDVISFCIEEIIDAVQENSAVIVAVNEAISAVDEENQNDILADGETVIDKITDENCENVQNKILESNQGSLVNSDRKIIACEGASKGLLFETSVSRESCLKKDNEVLNDKEHTNGKELPKNNHILPSKERKEENQTLLASESKCSNKSSHIGNNDDTDKENSATNNELYTDQNKNNKMKKLKRNTGGGSRFRLGNFLFGGGSSNSNNNNNDTSHKEPSFATTPTYVSLNTSHNSYQSLPIERQNSEVSTKPLSPLPKYHKSTTSLVKRSASKLSLGGIGGSHAYSCSQARSQHIRNQHNSSYQTLLVPDGSSDPSGESTPVLLAVRRRASSDSKPGVSSYGARAYGNNNNSSNDDSNYYSSNSSKDCSPCVHPRHKNHSFTNSRKSESTACQQQQTTNSSKLGFFRIFNKSLHALHPAQNQSHLVNDSNGSKDVQHPPKPLYLHKGVYSTLQNQKRGVRTHQVTSVISNSPTSIRTRTLPAAPSSQQSLVGSDLKGVDSVTSSAPVPRPVLPPKRITSNTRATFNAREHLMYMLRRRRKGGKFSPNTNNDYETIQVSKFTEKLGIPSLNAISSEPTSSSMSSINSTQAHRRREYRHQAGPLANRHPRSNVPNSSNGHQMTVRPQVHHHHNHSHNTNNRHLPVHSSSSTNSVNSTTSTTTEGNTGAETEGSGGIESINGNGSNYDSGAFSRTSSPADEVEGPPGPPPRLASAFRKVLQHSHSHDDILSSSASFRQNLSKLNPNHASTVALIEQMRSSLSASMSRLALEVEPLNAPALVMAATNGGSHHQHHCCNNCMPPHGCCEHIGDRCTIANINPSLVLACLNAASESSSLQQNFRGESVDSGVAFSSPVGTHCSGRNYSTSGFVRGANHGTNSSFVNDVSVTVGANTMLTISNANNEKVASALRRSRSGLPMLGTSGLMTTPSMKNNYHHSDQHPRTYTSTLPTQALKNNRTPNKKRNRISTVYLPGSSPSKNGDQYSNNGGCETLLKHLHQNSNHSTLTRPRMLPSSLENNTSLERSDSLVTVMGATIYDTSSIYNPDQIHCNCEEKVTVNGQHLHCPTTKAGRHPLANSNEDDSIYAHPPKPPPVDYPQENDLNHTHSHSVDLKRNINKERRPIRGEDEVFRFDPNFHSALTNDVQPYEPVLVDRSTNTSNRLTPVSVTSTNPDKDVVGDDYATNNNFSASNSEASQTQPNSLIII